MEVSVTTSSNNADFEDVIIVLHTHTDILLPRVHKGIKQDCITTYDTIGKIFFLF